MFGENIEVCMVNDGIVLLGIVLLIVCFDWVLELVECYVLECVFNLMSVGGI